MVGEEGLVSGEILVGLSPLLLLRHSSANGAALPHHERENVCVTLTFSKRLVTGEKCSNGNASRIERARFRFLKCSILAASEATGLLKLVFS